MPFPAPFDGRLVASRALTPGVRELTFERADGAPMTFEPGQWLNAILPVPARLEARAEGSERSESPPGPTHATVIKRSYSIASAPDGSPRFDVAVTRVQGGAGSAFLHEVGPGVVLRFIGPQGFFTRPATGGPPSLMIATGTGVTPMRSMLRAAISAGSATPVCVLLGVRHEQDLLYADELRALAASHPSVRFEPTLSQPGPGWTGRKGYVQTHVRALWDELAGSGAGEPHAYVCGLERMVGSVRELLRKEMTLPRQQVHSERYD